MRRQRLVHYLLLLLLLLAATGSSAVAADRPTGHQSKSLCSSAQSWRAARTMVDEPAPILLKGRVVRAYYASTSRGRPTFLDIGNGYPNRNRVTVVIWGKDRRNFPIGPEKMFSRGSSVCVMGFVYLFHGVPNIEVTWWDPKENVLAF